MACDEWCLHAGCRTGRASRNGSRAISRRLTPTSQAPPMAQHPMATSRSEEGLSQGDSDFALGIKLKSVVDSGCLYEGHVVAAYL